MSAHNENAPPRISVIIPVKDHLEKTEKLIHSIRSKAPEEGSFEIIVVDDGSQPPIPSNLAGDGVELIRLDQSHGPAHARNEGATRASGEILFFMDADVLYAPGAFKVALERMDEDETIQGISYCNQPFDNSDGWIDNFGAITERYYERDMLNGKPMAEIWALSSRNGAVRKSGFEAVGGFNPAYKTNAHEDYDFGKRLAAVGKLVIVDAPAFYHAFPDTIVTVLRNYWVRTSLFIPYALKYRPTLDPVQISYGEARVRALPGLILIAAFLALTPLPCPELWTTLSLFGTGIYASLTARFLALCKSASGSWSFTWRALGLHFLCSLAVCAGGTYGLLGYFSGMKVPEPRSSVR